MKTIECTFRNIPNVLVSIENNLYEPGQIVKVNVYKEDPMWILLNINNDFEPMYFKKTILKKWFK